MYTVSYVNATGTYATTNTVHSTVHTAGTVTCPKIAGVDAAAATEVRPTVLPASHADFAVYPYLTGSS